MTAERRAEIERWTDPARWPRWELVMYHNKVSVSESLDLMRSIKTVATFEHVRRGIEAYTGMAVRQAENEHGRFYMLVPDMAKRCSLSVYGQHIGTENPTMPKEKQ